MKRRYFGIWQLVFVVFLVLQGQFVLADQLAFPGAEGFGAFAQGGRGGDVYYVMNTNDSGAGSLRYGIDSASGPRTIVFAVSGLIRLQSRLKVNEDYITIAGQTAPGDGICLRDYEFTISADHVIVRYIRSRLGDDGGQESDAMSITSGHNIIMDHCSASWSVDEVFSCSTGDPYKIDNVTVQWSVISEGLGDSIHTKGYHSYGALIRGCYGARYSYHHNLFAHNNGRNPRPGNYDDNDYISDPLGLQFDFRNNVVYNWGGSKPSYDGDTDSVCRMNYVSNYFKAGPNGYYGNIYSTGSKHFMGYYEGNYFDGGITSNQYSLVDFHSWSSTEINNWIQSVPFSTGPIVTQTAQNAYADILDRVGASLVRDSVDTRITNDVIDGTGAIIDDEDEVGSWPVYNTYNVPTDTDRDGMSDEWELVCGLDPDDPDDRNDDRNSDGYTNLEEYLHWLTLPLPAVKIEATDSSAYEIDGDTAAFTVTRSGSTSGYLDVYLTIGGTAIHPDDYTATGPIDIQPPDAWVTIPDGASEAEFTITPVQDFVFEDTETVEITIEESPAFDYNIGSPDSAIAYIYAVQGTDLTDFAVLSEFWQSDCGGSYLCEDVDYDDSGSIGIIDLQEFALRWLTGKGEEVFVPVDYQAEDGDWSDGSKVDDKHDGYTGTGFVDTENDIGEWCEVTVNVPAGGIYNMSLRYANGSSDRPVEIAVDGDVAISNLSMPGTAEWYNWDSVAFSAQLNSSDNTIRFTALGSSGTGNIDKLTVESKL